jgi:integrase
MGIMASPYIPSYSKYYYIRIVIPQELRSVIGKREFKSSLKTTDKSEAQLRAIPWLKDAYEQLALARSKLSGDSDVDLSLRECVILAERWYARMRDEVESQGSMSSHVSRDEYQGVDGSKGHLTFGLSDTLSLQGSDIERATEQQLDILGEELELHIVSQLDIEGITVPKRSKSYRQLAVQFYHYLYKFERLCIARSQNDWESEPSPMKMVETPIKPKPLRRTSVASENALSEVYKKFRISRDVNSESGEKVSKTLNETDNNIQRFISLHGDKDVAEVTSADFVLFRDTLLQLPKKKSQDIRSLPVAKQVEKAKVDSLPTLSRAVAKKNFNLVSSVFTFAVELGLLSENPALKVKPPKTAKRIEAEEDRGYTPEEVAKLFSLPLFTDPKAHKKYGMACYWVPILCRYTGARSGEILQLRESDIDTDHDGIHYINVRRGEGQSVKNNASLRHIPLHDHLIELGFLEFVQGCKDWLFPEVPADKYGAKSTNFASWWGKVVRAQGIDIHQPTHAFRHAFKTMLRTLGASDRVNDAITGHTSGSVGDKYGTVYLKTKKEVIDKVAKLRLSHLYG